MAYCFMCNTVRVQQPKSLLPTADRQKFQVDMYYYHDNTLQYGSLQQEKYVVRLIYCIAWYRISGLHRGVSFTAKSVQKI